MKKETAVLAGGCFWGMEELLSSLPGVLETEVGYCGGVLENPFYEQVKKGNTGHAESVKVVFDSDKLSYQQLLSYFFRIHDPTTPNRQMGDFGHQYRSVVFYMDENQKNTAIEAIASASKNWKDPIVTEVVEFKKFWKAEEYHQKYLKKNPGGYTCHFERKF